MVVKVLRLRQVLFSLEEVANGVKQRTTSLPLLHALCNSEQALTAIQEGLNNGEQAL